MKRFLRRIIIGGMPLVAVALCVAYFSLFVKPYMVGDLGVLGKIGFDREYENSFRANPFPEYPVMQYQPGDSLADVVTVGDSFSQQGYIGYQNFLSHKIGKVSNLPIDREKITSAQAAFNLVNSGFFDNFPNVRYVVVESVERELVRFWSQVDRAGKDTVLPLSAAFAESGKPDDPRNVMGKCFRQGIDWLKITIGADENPVKRLRLDRECFTIPGKESMLYFYHDDLTDVVYDDSQVEDVADKLADLHARYQAKGIKMLFLLAPDKYEIYQHYAVDNPFPPKMVGAQLAGLDTLGFVVNPIPEMLRRIDDGEKDMYMANDSHWSYKSSRLVADLLYEKMK